MTFGVRHARVHLGAAFTLALAVGGLIAGQAQASSYGNAIVPKQIIYPGQEIDLSQVTEVEVTNPNLAAGYAQKLADVDGMVATRTLLPGRTIMINGLREAWTVKRGDKVLLIFDNGVLKITASGTPLADAVVGDLIKARNTDTGVIISGTVNPDGSILVVQK
jgi:flagella basal body P-ring formation protein FlgA